MKRSLLLVCPSCERHVRAVDASCPFCGLVLSVSERSALALRPPRVRLGRAALYALSVGSLSLAACGGATTADNDASDDASAAESGSETGSGFDARCCPPYGHVPEDAGNPLEASSETVEGGDESTLQEASNGDAPMEATIAPPYGHPAFDAGSE
jgi:hypothetical protein